MRALILGTFLLACSACSVDLSSFGDSHRDSTSFFPPTDMTDIHTLRLRGVNGAILVTAKDQSVCDGSIQYSTSANTAEDLAKKKAKVRLLEHRKDGVLTLTLDGDPNSASFDLGVPAGLNLDLETSNDEIRISGAFHSFQLDTSNDDIIIELTEGLSADSKANTSNGDIKVTCVTALNAAVKTGTSNGKTTLQTIQADSPHELILDTSNGDIEVKDGLEQKST